MTKTIVERIREIRFNYDFMPLKLGLEAADEIERLEKLIASMVIECDENMPAKAAWLARRGGDACSQDEPPANPLEHVCPSCGRPPGATEALEALRYRYLTEDIANREEREARNALLARMAVMSYSAASTEIDFRVARLALNRNE
jgi:hypothetical protein